MESGVGEYGMHERIRILGDQRIFVEQEQETKEQSIG